MPADNLPHPLLAPEVDLLLGDGGPLGRWGDRGGDHRADSIGNPEEISLCHGRQVVFQGDHVVAEQTSERGIEHRLESGIEQCRNIPECVARHDELDAVCLRQFVREFLPQRPEVRHPRRDFELCTRSLGEMRAPDAIADDPVIDRFALQVVLASHDMERWRRGSANRQTAQPPEVDLGRKPVAGSVLGHDIKDWCVPLPPGFELIARAENLRCKTIRFHRPPRSVPPLT